MVDVTDFTDFIKFNIFICSNIDSLPFQPISCGFLGKSKQIGATRKTSFQKPVAPVPRTMLLFKWEHFWRLKNKTSYFRSHSGFWIWSGRRVCIGWWRVPYVGVKWSPSVGPVMESKGRWIASRWRRFSNSRENDIFWGSQMFDGQWEAPVPCSPVGSLYTEKNNTWILC